MPLQYSADLPVTDVVPAVIDPVTPANNVAGTFTCLIDNPALIVMSAATKAAAIEVVVTMDSGIEVPVIVGDTMSIRLRKL